MVRFSIYITVKAISETIARNPFQDQVIVGFGIFMGFVDKKETIENQLDLSFTASNLICLYI